MANGKNKNNGSKSALKPTEATDEAVKDETAQDSTNEPTEATDEAVKDRKFTIAKGIMTLKGTKKIASAGDEVLESQLSTPAELLVKAGLLIEKK